ncbi:outer membrane beta-barrel protein [Myxococcus sp. Y35]|uniref:outer membrane beta-barrel protein n=1 Tax=Pseudomyxococcus flavus TaxID=3115648 RepID=UPI003CE87D12
MNSQLLWKLTALSLTLSAPALASSWRDDGNIRRKQVDASDSEYGEEAKEDKGFALGLRAGYGLPLGQLAAETDMGDLVSGAIPLQVDAGYFFNANFYLGAYFQYAPVFTADDCMSGTSCSGSQMRFGVNASYHFREGEKLRPWLGLGIGYEMLSVKVSADDSSITTGYRGIELASVQGGADYRLTDAFSIGPYLSLAAGIYQTGTIKFENAPIFGDAEESIDIEDTAVHAWLSGGVRVQYRF